MKKFLFKKKIKMITNPSANEDRNVLPHFFIYALRSQKMSLFLFKKIITSRAKESGVKLKAEQILLLK